MSRILGVARKKRSFVQLAAVLVLVFLSGCANPYIGRRVNVDTKAWCMIRRFPQTGQINRDDFIFTFNVNKGEAADEYVIQGTARYKGAGGFNTLIDVPSGAFQGSRIELYLSRDGVLSDVVPLSMVGDNLNADLPFRRTFKTRPFDALAFSYQVTVGGY